MPHEVVKQCKLCFNRDFLSDMSNGVCDTCWLEYIDALKSRVGMVRNVQSNDYGYHSERIRPRHEHVVHLRLSPKVGG